MSITNAGRDLITLALCGSAFTNFNSANAYIGIGSNSATAFSNTQTALVSALTSARNGMESGYPIVTTNQMQFRSNFTTTQANGAWEEWGVFNTSAGATMLNRKVEPLGTKPGTQTWQFTVTITITVP